MSRKPTKQQLSEASEWQVRLEMEPSDAEQQEFEQWLAANAGHEQAWQEIQKTWLRLPTMRRRGATAMLDRVRRQEKHESRRLLTLLSLCLLLPLAWLLFDMPSSWLADHATAVGERETLQLSDGSRLELNTATAVDVEFSATKRQVWLYQGELYIDVASDRQQRPLHVITDHGTVEVLGTRFGVQWLTNGIQVTVYESQVQLCVEANRCQHLQGGQQVTAIDGQIGTVQALAVQQPAWLNGLLIIDDQPLTEVLNELARYHRGWLQFDAAELDGLQVSGSLPLNDLVHALDALTVTLPIEVQSYGGWVFVVELQEEAL